MVNLSHGCWGHASVCLGTRCGGVCEDTWSHNLSTMLCQSLGCGQPVQPVSPSREASQQVLISSFQTTAHTRSLSQSAMVLDHGSCSRKPAYVVCSGTTQASSKTADYWALEDWNQRTSPAAGSIRTSIQPSRSKCSGKVEVFYEGQWLPVSKEALQSPATQNSICRELRCGRAFQITDYVEPAPPLLISKIKCPPDGSAAFKDCNSSVLPPTMAAPALGGLRCSGMSHLSV